MPAEDGCIRSYYNALQYTLYETGFPETEDRTKCLSMNNGKDRVTVAVLSSPLECIGMLLEGNLLPLVSTKRVELGSNIKPLYNRVVMNLMNIRCG